MDIVQMILKEVNGAAARYGKIYNCSPESIGIAIQFALHEVEGGCIAIPVYHIVKDGELVGENLSSKKLLDLGLDLMQKSAIIDNYLSNRYAVMSDTLDTNDIAIVINNAPSMVKDAPNIILFKVVVDSETENKKTFIKTFDFNYNALAALNRLAAELNEPVNDISINVEKYDDNIYYKVRIRNNAITTEDGRHKYYRINEIMDIQFEFIDNEAGAINDFLLKKIKKLTNDGISKPMLLIQKTKASENIICYVYNILDTGKTEYKCTTTL